MASHRNMWNAIEKITGIIPKYLKNILELNGYDTPVVIQNITDEDILFFENFAKNEMENVIPPGADLADYYDRFSTNKENFQILRGHKKLLHSMASVVKKKINETGVSFFTTPSFSDNLFRETRHKMHTTSTPRSTTSRASSSVKCNREINPLEEDQTLTPARHDSKINEQPANINPHINLETDVLKKLLYDYLKKNCAAFYRKVSSLRNLT